LRTEEQGLNTCAVPLLKAKKRFFTCCTHSLGDDELCTYSTRYCQTRAEELTTAASSALHALLYCFRIELINGNDIKVLAPADSQQGEWVTSEAIFNQVCNGVGGVTVDAFRPLDHVETTI
jgi:hypothetical protein